MSSHLDVFHPRHAGAPIKFSENNKALVIPARPRPVLLVEQSVKINTKPLNDALSITSPSTLGTLLGSGRHKVPAGSALTYFAQNHPALRQKGDELTYLRGLYSLLKNGKVLAYHWPYSLPVGIRPNPRAGFGALKASPVAKPIISNKDLDIEALKAEKRRNAERPHQAPSPEMPDGYTPARAPDVGSIEPIEGNPYLGLFKHIISESTGGVILGDTGSVNSFKPSPQDMADIAAFKKASPDGYAAATLIAPGNKVKAAGKALGKAGSLGDKVTPSAIENYFDAATVGVSPKIIQARERQAAMLDDNVGFNISPSAWDNYPTIGRNGTYISDKQGITDVIGDFSGQTQLKLDKSKVNKLEKSFGLEEGSLQDGFKVRRVDNIADKMSRSPMEGNQYFLGPGNHLPSGAPEMVIDSIPTVDTNDVTTLLEVLVK